MDKNKILSEIAKYGWTVIAVEASDYLPSYAYTIGLLSNYQHPEIIIFGLPVNVLHHTLNEAGNLIKSGKKFEANSTYDDFFENGKVHFLTVDPRNIADYFSSSFDTFLGNMVSAIELVWTDRQYRFPWDEGFEDEFKFKQPLLDRNAHFKFLEDQNLIVFTTKDQNRAILRVIHNTDTNWYFLSDDSELELQETSLVDIILKDTSLNALFDLDYGQCAERKSLEDKWERRLVE